MTLIGRCRAAMDDLGALDARGAGTLHRALTVVLDGIRLTLEVHRSSRGRCLRCGSAVHPCPDTLRATASLDAIAQALGVKP